MIKKILIILVGIIFIFIIIGFVSSRNQDKLLESIDQAGIVDDQDLGENTDQGLGEVYSFEVRDGAVSGDYENVVINNYKLTFTGFAVGKSHVSEFKNADVEIFLNNESDLTGGKVTLYSNSIKAGIDQLDTHLQTDKFLNSEVYPEITFSTSAESFVLKDGTSVAEIEGTLNFLGQSKTVQFPMTAVVDGNKFALDVDTALDLEEFGFDPEPLAKSEVRMEGKIEFEIK